MTGSTGVAPHDQAGLRKAYGPGDPVSAAIERSTSA